LTTLLCNRRGVTSLHEPFEHLLGTLDRKAAALARG